MSLFIARRVVLSLAGASLLLTAVPAAQATADAPTYELTVSIPLGLKPYSDLAVDRANARVYLALRDGLRVVDINRGEVGPAATGIEASGAIEAAPDINRVFAEVNDDYVGFIDADSLELDQLVPVKNPGRIVYEPITREVYVFSPRQPTVVVFDGRTAEKRAEIALPGWNGDGVLKTPGRIYVVSNPRRGLYAIETSERMLRPVTLPAGIDFPASEMTIVSDPAGRVLFVADDYEIFAVDASSGERLGRARTRGRANLMYDNEAGMLMAQVSSLDWPHGLLVGYRLDGEDGLVQVSEQRLSFEAEWFPTPTESGFVSAFKTGAGDPAGRGLPQTLNNYLSVWKRATN